MFRAVLNLFGKWELTDEQAASLLDMPVRSYRRWKAEGPGRVSRDGAARLSNLMGIHKALRSEEHTSELQSLMRISYAVFCLKKKNHATRTSGDGKHDQMARTLST